MLRSYTEWFWGLIAARTRDTVRYMALFTAENAATMGRKGAMARWTPKPEPQVAEPPAAIQPPIAEVVAEPIADGEKQRALARVLKQLQDVDKLIDEAQDAKAWDMLTRAKERLAKVWFHLGGIAGPGQMKPQAQPKAKRAYTQIPQGWQPPPQAPPPEFA